MSKPDCDEEAFSVPSALKRIGGGKVARKQQSKAKALASQGLAFENKH